MNKSPIRLSIMGRSRRVLRRRAWWILLLALLGARFIYRNSALPPAESEAPIIAFAQYPPAALLRVHVKYEDFSLREIFEDLSRQAGIPFHVEYQSFRMAGFDGTSKVTLDSGTTDTVPLWRVIDMLHTQWTGDAIEADFTASPVLIANKSTVNSPARQTTVIYPIADLLGLRDPWASRETPWKRAESLRFLILVLVEPGQWAENGGTSRAEHGVGETLVVRATPKVHFQVRQLLDALRNYHE